MDKLANPLFGLLATLLVWWFMADVLDTFADPFFEVITFGAALIFTVAWLYDLFEILTGSGDNHADSD